MTLPLQVHRFVEVLPDWKWLRPGVVSVWSPALAAWEASSPWQVFDLWTARANAAAMGWLAKRGNGKDLQLSKLKSLHKSRDKLKIAAQIMLSTTIYEQKVWPIYEHRHLQQIQVSSLTSTNQPTTILPKSPKELTPRFSHFHSWRFRSGHVQHSKWANIEPVGIAPTRGFARHVRCDVDFVVYNGCPKRNQTPRVGKKRDWKSIINFVFWCFPAKKISSTCSEKTLQNHQQKQHTTRDETRYCHTCRNHTKPQTKNQTQQNQSTQSNIQSKTLKTIKNTLKNHSPTLQLHFETFFPSKPPTPFDSPGWAWAPRTPPPGSPWGPAPAARPPGAKPETEGAPPSWERSKKKERMAFLNMFRYLGWKQKKIWVSLQVWFSENLGCSHCNWFLGGLKVLDRLRHRATEGADDLPKSHQVGHCDPLKNGFIGSCE